MFRVATFSAVFIIAMTASNLTFAVHPLITDDAETQGKGNFELEVNGQYSLDRQEGTKEVVAQPASQLTYGVTDNLDIVLGVPWQWVRTRTPVSEVRVRGFSDANLDLKWRFHNKGGLELAIKPGITFPLGNEKNGLGAGNVTYKFFFIATKEIKPLEFHLNLGYLRNENKIDERKDIWHASLAAEYEVFKDFEIVANIGIERNRDKTSGPNPAFILGGFVYTILKDFDVDLGVKYGLTEPDVDLTYMAGITLRF